MPLLSKLSTCGFSANIRHPPPSFCLCPPLPPLAQGGLTSSLSSASNVLNFASGEHGGVGRGPLVGGGGKGHSQTMIKAEQLPESGDSITGGLYPNPFQPNHSHGSLQPVPSSPSQVSSETCVPRIIIIP